MSEKKYTRIVYCERCNHPEDRHEEFGGCSAPTVMAGAPKCKCPRMVYPTGGALASLTQRLMQETGRRGQLPPPFEAERRDRR